MGAYDAGEADGADAADAADGADAAGDAGEADGALADPVGQMEAAESPFVSLLVSIEFTIKVCAEEKNGCLSQIR